MNPLSRRTLLGGLTAAALAGCTGVPTNGPVRQVTAHPGRADPGVQIAPAPPGPDVSSAEVVEGFLHAMAAYQPEYAVARAYLTREASERWRPEAGVRIYAEGYNPDGDILTAPLVGRLSPDGAFAQVRGQVAHDFGLVRDDAAQWRISRPPEGRLVSQYLFNSAFLPCSVHFFAPGRDWLVPDRRYLPRGPRSLEHAARAVLGGASAWLAPVVENATEGLELESLTLGADGTARVLIRRPAEALSSGQRERLGVQLVWTLQQFPNVAGVTLGHPGEDAWALPGSGGGVVPAGAYPDADPVLRQTSRQLFAITAGRLARVFEGGQGRETVEVAPAVRAIGAAAVRPDALQAAVVNRGRTELSLASVSEPNVGRVLVARGLGRPHFSRLGELWVPTADALVVVEPSGTWREVGLEAPAGSRVMAVRVAPDAARLALVLRLADGRSAVGVGRIRRSGDELTVESWRELALTVTDGARPLVSDVGWTSAEELLVLHSDGRGAGVVSLDADGAELTPVGPVGLDDVVELAVAPGVPPMARMAGGQVYRYFSEYRWAAYLEDVAGISYPG